ncbi:MAG: 30S ribosome-binding factor RbfA [Bacteroidota bacterium]
MESKRQIRYGKQIQKDIAEIFQKDPLYYFRSALGTVTGVSVSPDLGFAKIYLSILPIGKSSEIFEHLEQIKPEIRLKLGKKIGERARIVPEIAFYHDDTEEQASRIDQIIDNLNIPSEDT